MEGEYKKAHDTYSGIAKRNGFNPQNIFTSMGRFNSDGSFTSASKYKDLPVNPTAANLEKGTIYNTPRGPAMWDGFRFVVERSNDGK